MINSFENYLKLGKAKRKTPDTEEANSLFQKAKDRVELTKERKINEKSASFILEDSYEAIRESAQALMSIKGYKPYSHEATISFLKYNFGKSFSEEELAVFDRFRQLRNNSVYTAENIRKEDAIECLKFSIIFLKKIKNLLKQ